MPSGRISFAPAASLRDERGNLLAGCSGMRLEWGGLVLGTPLPGRSRMNWFVPNRRVAAFLSIVAISVGAAGKTATAETVGSSALRGSSILARPIGGAFAGG